MNRIHAGRRVRVEGFAPALVAVALLVIGLAPVTVASGQDVCWRDSYGRGVGTIPTTCPSGQVNDAGLCYDTCRAGYENGGPLCLTSCPSGFDDTGLHCLKPAAYGRGAGYAFVPLFEDLSDARSRCEEDEGRGQCEQWGLMYYPKCRAGFSAFGSNVCSPTCPSNMTDIGVSCEKGSYGRGVGTIPSTCGRGEEYDAGLCYENCDAATFGVGPVCWSGSCPADFPVSCGAACAVSQNACVNSILKQVLSTTEVAVNVGLLVTTGGAANAGLKAAQTTARVTGRTVLSASARQSAKAAYKSKLAQSAARQRLRMADNVLDLASEALVESKVDGEFDFEMLDPTGVVAVVNAFNKPICGTTTPTTTTAAPRPGPAPAPAPIPTTGFVRFQNRWRANQYLHVQDGSIQSGDVQPGWWSAMWTIEQVPGSSFVRIKNRWRTDQYLHVQNGPLESGAAESGWWSAMWTIEEVPGSSFVRIQNRWRTDQYLHVQNGPLESGPVESGWWSAMWTVGQVR